MDLVTLPQALFVFYGALVLGCGGTLGFILGRNFGRPRRVPPPDDLSRRLRLVEEELEIAQSELVSLRDAGEFTRRLGEAPEPRRSEPSTEAA